jgi:hypothetical protein
MGEYSCTVENCFDGNQKIAKSKRHVIRLNLIDSQILDFIIEFALSNSKIENRHHKTIYVWFGDVLERDDFILDFRMKYITSFCV